MIFILGFLLFFSFTSLISASKPKTPKDEITEINIILKGPLNKALSDFLSIGENWDSLSRQETFLQEILKDFMNIKEVKKLLSSFNEGKKNPLMVKYVGGLTNPQSFNEALHYTMGILYIVRYYHEGTAPTPLSENEQRCLDLVDPLNILKVVYHSFQICLYSKDVETLFDNLDLLKGLQSVVPKPLDDGKSLVDPHPNDKESATDPHPNDKESKTDPHPNDKESKTDPHPNDKESKTDPHPNDGNSDTTKTSDNGKNLPPSRWSNLELALIIGGIALVVIGIVIIVLKKKKSTTLPV
jgi:hypothetical protein